MKIVSKRNWFIFSLGYFLPFLIISFVATMLIFIFFNKLENDNLKSIHYFIPILSPSLYCIAFYSLFYFFKYSKKIIIENDIIIFNKKEKYPIKDIEHVELTGKFPIKFIIKSNVEGVAIKFKNGISKVFYESFYSNLWQIKHFLQQVVVNNEEFKLIDNYVVESDEIMFEQTEDFSGYQFTSIINIVTWFFTLLFSYLLIKSIKDLSFGLLIFSIIYLLFLLLANSYISHYFKVSKKYFIVKNQIIPLNQSIYRIDNIKEIVFESRNSYRGSINSLRVITKDYRNKSFKTVIINYKQWLKLKDCIEQKGIKVRNELDFVK